MFRSYPVWVSLFVFSLMLPAFAGAQKPAEPSSSTMPSWMQPYRGPSRRDIGADTIVGKVLCGYQGWFRAPGDPTGGGWVHWSRNRNRIAPETLTFEMWPDMTEYSPEEQYPADGFTYPDGKQATLFSSANPKTVERHFDWMQRYGIDGVLVQRFLGGLDGAEGSVKAARVLGAVRNAANRTGRVFAVEYDMSGVPPERALAVMQKDWKFLVDEMKITDDPRYLKQNGKPVIAIFGFFKDRFSGDWANRIIDAFHSQDKYGVFLIGGCQWWWRTEKDPDWMKAFRRLDAIKPWNVGNWGTYSGIPGARTDYWAEDQAEAKRAGMLYLPVLYPGFSWNNLQRNPADTPGIPRLGGQFLRTQFETVVKEKIDQVFVAMFDEVDEGTAIFKVTNTPPTPGHFVTFEGKPSDFYLKLTGEGTRLVHEDVKRRGVLKSASAKIASKPRNYRFDKKISREVLENYLTRSISMEGLLNGRGDLEDNIRMLKSTGAKFIGRSLCLWAGEANLLRNLQRAKVQIPRVHAADPEMILQACVFEIVTTQVEQIPVPDWAFKAMGQPVEKRNFRYADMLSLDGRRHNQWGRGSSVPDVSRPETKLWFYFLAASYIDLGIEAIHFGQAELMNGSDPSLEHWDQVLTLVRSYAAKHARRHMVLCDAHVPGGGLVREGRLLLDFHSFPLRIMEVPEKPQEAILKLGFSDGIYNRSKGGRTYSGWKCEHLPYLVEIDNWGASRQPGQAKAGGIWVWGYDEITWFAHQSKAYRADWLRYARDWVQKTDPSGHLQMPGSRTMRSPLDNKRWYYANVPSVAVPEGLGDEEAIRDLWADDGEGESPSVQLSRTPKGVFAWRLLPRWARPTRARPPDLSARRFAIRRTAFGRL